MQLPESSRHQFTSDLNICRILNGMWQVSGAHGPINPEEAVQSMFKYFDSGFTTWDLADIYGPAEEFIGEFRRQLSSSHGEEALAMIQAFTKWVPEPHPISKKVVEQSVSRSLQRMNMDSLDLLQFHWWVYRDKSYMDALIFLSELKDDGKIKHLGLTNFDTEHLKQILENGIKIVSNQIQFSIIDRRPEVNMIPLCKEHDVQVLAYGTLCGGLLSDRYLGRPEPQSHELDTASLVKYKRMIDAWGGWNLFQELLSVLKKIANKYNVSIANVAVRYILEKPTSAGVIVGARLGVSDNRKDNYRVFNFSLDKEDNDLIDSITDRSNDLYKLIGDCGDEYR